MTLDNPFADVSPWDAETNTPAPEEMPMTTAPVTNAAAHAPSAMEKPMTDGNRVRVTLKGGTSFDAPWITIDGRDVADALAQLNRKDEVKQLVDAAAKVGSYFASLGSASAPAPAPKRFENGKVVPAGPGGDNGGHTCDHGPRNFKDGGSWAAYFCGGRGLDKSAQCPPLWRQKDGSFRAN